MADDGTIAAIRALRPAGFDPAPGLWRELGDAFASPGRHYHTLRHVREVAERFDEVTKGPGWAAPVDAWLAVLFHDAVYDPARPDNEAQSAALCASSCTRWLDGRHPAAEALILLTAQHGHNSAALDADARHFLDCDMAILGADSARFAEYERDVALEYAAVYPPDAYAFGRRAFLQALQAAPRLFLSDRFHERLDAQARTNCRDALARLDPG